MHACFLFWLKLLGIAGFNVIVLLAPMPPPFGIGISGATRAGKTTLANGLLLRFCGPDAEREPRTRRRDKVERYVGIDGFRVGVMRQDSCFLASAGHAGVTWDCPEALNHDMIVDVLQQELSDTSLDCIIFEGFKAFHDERVPKLLELLIWLEVPKEVAWCRKNKRNCTEQHFTDQIWSNHLRYVKDKVSQYDQRLQRLCGMERPHNVLDAAVAMVRKQNPKMKSAADAVDAAAKHPRPQRPQVADPMKGQSLARQVFMCANRSCWFAVHDSGTCGGYCCEKCHWRKRTGHKSGKDHERSCAKMPAPKGSSRADATPPANPKSWGVVAAWELKVIKWGTVSLVANCLTGDHSRKRARPPTGLGNGDGTSWRAASGGTSSNKGDEGESDSEADYALIWASHDPWKQSRLSCGRFLGNLPVGSLL